MREVLIIGDVHGLIWRYLQLTSLVERSIQVGDMGFAGEYAKLMAEVDPEKHKFIPGNHDDYDHLPPHALGDFGPLPWFSNGFFVRGAWSIDKAYRTPHVSWWPNEELNVAEAEVALETYAQVKPEVMITHTAPSSVAVKLADPAFGGYFDPSTERLLEEMPRLHRPDLWIFGHWHTSWNEKIDGTEFRCLNELEVFSVKVP